jgi:hypothetical protein
MNDDKVCSVCLLLKPVACELPNRAPLCFDCVVKGTEYGHRTVMEKKRACVEAKLAVVAQMECKCRDMHDEILRELDALGMSVEDRVEFLARNGRKIDAIKLHRDATGKTLMESKKYVDDLENW